MNDIEKIGRILCKDYYNGSLKGKNIETQVVERVVCRNTGWLELMAGLLSRAKVAQRIRSLGAGFDRDGLCSIDGREDFLRTGEVAMYAAVGAEYRKELKKVLCPTT